MNKHKLWGLGICLVVVLMSLLAFQVQWLLTSAKLKEDQFRHRVTMALCSAVEELGKDKKICSALASCSVKQGGGLIEFVGVQQGSHIESIVDRYLRFYQIDIPFNVSLSNTSSGFVQAKIPNLENASIHIDFPSRQDFILSELNGMFITSFLLIAILIIICSITLQWLFRQRQIQMDTVDYIDAMSHELKTPINNISLALAMLGKQLPTGKVGKVNHYLDVAIGENQSLKYKINEVLGTASLERILGNQTNEICDIHELTALAQSRLKVKAEERQATFKLKLQAKQTKVKSDRNELLNVLVCLLDNALTYVNGQPEIELETASTHEQIEISISDNGIGIPEALQEQVFEKYYTNGHDLNGHGVGLFVVKKIIQRCGGSISLESKERAGSKFTILLPTIS